MSLRRPSPGRDTSPNRTDVRPPRAPTRGEKLAEMLRSARGVEGARRAVFSRIESESRR